MNIVLERIKLQNFKGIRDLTVDFGQNTRIFGMNETGKTTLLDGFMWALFGKDSLNSASFDIKTLKNGVPIHNLEHSVEVSLVADGRPVILQKVYEEKWTKKRGSASKEFSGHTTNHFFNGVPVQEKEFKERIAEVIDEKIFRLLTDPRYFNEVLPWTDRRAILMKVCGDVTADEVIASDKSLAGLTSILNGNSIDDYKRTIAAKRKEINDQLQKIPTRIDEVRRSMVDIRADIEAVPGQIKDLETKKADLESQLADARNGGALSKKRIELNEIVAEIQSRKNAHEQDKGILMAPLRKELEALQNKEAQAKKKARDLEAEVVSKKGQILDMERCLEKLRAEYDTLDEQKITVTDKCPSCGHPLPAEQVNSAREKANNAKAEGLSEIQKQGRETAKALDELKASIEEEGERLGFLKGDVGEVLSEIEAKEKQISDIRAQEIDFTDLETRKASVQAEIDNIGGAEKGVIDGIQAQINKARFDIDCLERNLAQVKANENAEKRVKELEAEEKDLAAQYEAIEQSLFLVEKFIRTKTELLDTKINSKFSIVRFKLFADQINGGLQEVCETTLNGVPYPSINNAGRIQAGMDIIRTLQAHYGINCAVWLDNAEAVVDVPDIGCQLIQLIVSGQDKVLRIESSDRKESEKAA